MKLNVVIRRPFLEGEKNIELSRGRIDDIVTSACRALAVYLCRRGRVEKEARERAGAAKRKDIGASDVLPFLRPAEKSSPPCAKPNGGMRDAEIEDAHRTDRRRGKP